MSVLINKMRRRHEAVLIRNNAQVTVERYEGYRKPFIDWAHQTGLPEVTLAAELEALDGLIAQWRAAAERGEADPFAEIRAQMGRLEPTRLLESLRSRHSA